MNVTPSRFRAVSLLLATAAICLAAGCAANQPHTVQTGPAATPSNDAAPAGASSMTLLPISSTVASAAAPVQARPDIQTAPLDYLRYVARKCAALEQYSLRFTRLERRGLFPFISLQGPEDISVRFRRTPFSVRMSWLDSNVKYGESTYVAGQADNKVRFVPRNGLFGLPPVLTRVDLLTPVRWGESKRPLTDFGLERLVVRALDSFESSGGAATIQYDGIRNVPQRDYSAHCLRLDYPRERFPAPRVFIYVDAQTDLPVCTQVFLPAGALDASYHYESLDTHVHFDDDDFLLDAERRTPAADAPVIGTE